MNLLLSFAPFLAFASIERLAGARAGLLAGALIAGALIAGALLVRDVVSPARHVKLLEAGTVLLFGSLAVYALTSDVHWSIAAVRLRVDAGLALIVLASIALRRPFTLQYARETVGRELWNSARFIHVDYVISAAWALAFGMLVLADIAMAYAPALPHSVGVMATVAALVAAVKFTSWYPEQHAAGR